MKSWLSRVSAAQWLLAGGLVVVITLGAMSSNQGTAWQTVSGLSFSPDGRSLAIGLYSGRLRSLRERWYVADVGHRVAVATPTEDRPPRILGRELSDGIVNMLPEVFIGPSVAFADNGTLTSAGLDGRLDVWDAVSGSLLRSIPTGRDHIRTIVSLPARQGLVTSFRTWASRWDRDLQFPPRFLETGVNIQTAAPSPDGKQIAFGGIFSRDIEFWDTRDDRLLLAARPGVANSMTGITSMVYTPDGKTLVVADDEHVSLHDVATMRTTSILPDRLVLTMAVSPDGRQLATGRYDGVALWDLPRRGLLLFRLNGPAVASLQFNPDGRLLAAGSSDGSVRVWAVESGKFKLIWSWSFPPSEGTELLGKLTVAAFAAWMAVALIYASLVVKRRRRGIFRI